MPNLPPSFESVAQRGFLGTVIVETIIVLAMLIASLVQVGSVVNVTSEDYPQYRTLVAYLALFGLAEIFHLALSYDALRLRNIIQVAGLLIFHFALIVFAGIQIEQTQTALLSCFTTNESTNQSMSQPMCEASKAAWPKVLPLHIVVPSVLFASWLISIYFSWKLYSEFGWAVFRMVGANPRMKRMFRWYQIQIVLLKFDLYAFIGLTMQLLILVLEDGSPEFGLTIAAIPVVFALLVGAGLAVSREIRWLMIVSLVLMMSAQAYFIFKFIRLFLPETRQQYDTSRKTIGIFIVSAAILLFATFVVGLICYNDFGKGLKKGKAREPTSIPRLNLTEYRRDSKGNVLSPLSSPAATPGWSDHRGNSYYGNLPTSEDNSYAGGQPLQPRMSIE